MIPRCLRYAAAAAAAICMASAASVPAAAAKKKVIVVVANRLILPDILGPGLPTIQRMTENGAVGLISPNCLGAKTEASVVLTAASGASCRARQYVSDCFDEGEALPSGTADGEYYLRTGKRAPSGSAVFLGIAEARRDNSRIGDLASICALGEAVRSSGAKTCAAGNADIAPDVFDRSHAALASDSQGLIDIGLLGSPRFGEAVSSAAFSDALARAAAAGLDRADLTVLGFGVTTVLDEMKISLSDEAYAAHRTRALRQLDRLMRRVIEAGEARGAVVVLVSFSPPGDGPWAYLTPIVIYPADRGGLLTSASTRTPGLIAASDFAPTLCGIMGIDTQAAMFGRAAVETPTDNKIDTLRAMSSRVAAQRVLETPMLWAVAAVGAVCVTLTAVAVGFGILQGTARLLRFGLVLTAGFPLAMLAAAAAPPTVFGYVMGTAAALVLTVMGAYAVSHRAEARAAAAGLPPPRAFPVAAVFWATAAAVVIDSAFGGNLCKFALPSSFQISGYRYYGIGNEYAAILISMSAIAVLMGPAHARQRLAAVIGVLVTAFLGSGFLGANYGASVAAVVTFGLLWSSLRRGSLAFADVVLWGIIGALTAAFFALLDWKLSGPGASHGGRAAAVGGSYWLGIMARKALLNARLISSKTAENAFLVFVPFFALWFWRLQPVFARSLGPDRAIRPGLGAVLAGAAAAFLANDSGVVMAAIFAAMTTLAVLYSMLETRDREWQG